MIATVERISAFVLAGGRSSRMGADKAMLMFEGRTLLARALELAGEVAGDVCIVGSRGRFEALGRVVEDVYPGCGPLGGIHAALAASPSELNLVLAVDMPFVAPSFLRRLVERASDSSAVVTLAGSPGRWQPLCAVYRRSFGGVADKALRAGKYKIDALFSEIEVQALSDADLAEMSLSPGMFRNLNTPSDVERALKPAPPARNPVD